MEVERELSDPTTFQIGITLSKHDDFAKEPWFPSALGKNVLSRVEGQTLRCAIVHKTGAYIIDIPRHLLKFSKAAEKWFLQFPPEIKDVLPEIDETSHIRVFQITPESRLLDTVFIRHPFIKNLYLSQSKKEHRLYLLIEGEAYGIGIDKKLIVQ